MFRVQLQVNQSEEVGFGVVRSISISTEGAVECSCRSLYSNRIRAGRQQTGDEQNKVRARREETLR